MLALLQFDACSVPVLQRLLEEGRLPTLAQLRERGRWHALGRSTPLFVEAGSYATLYTGRETSDHGIYSAFLWSAAEQRLRFMDAFPAPLTVWERLSFAGRRSLVIDPYESWTPQVTTGLRLMNGWQFRHKLIPRCSAPDGAQRELSRRFGREPMLEQPYGGLTPARLHTRRGPLLESPGRAADAIAHILEREQFDLLWVTFAAAHFAGHHFWEFAQRSKGQPSEPRFSEFESTLGDAYAAVDAALARVVEALPPDSDVIVLSPIGMGPETSRSDLLPDMVSAVLAGRPVEGAAENGAGNAIWRLRAAVPSSWRGAVTRPIPGPIVRDVAARLYLRGVDWRETRAFALPGDHYGYVRLNLRGRERAGIVGPAGAPELLEELAEGLATFRDPDGELAIAAVHRVAEELGDGRGVERLPDLVVRWSDRPSRGLAGVSSPIFGDVARRGVGSGRSGNHTTDGWAIVAPGTSRVRTPDRPPQIADLAATACHLLGADMSGLAGQPLLDPA